MTPATSRKEQVLKNPMTFFKEDWVDQAVIKKEVKIKWNNFCTVCGSPKKEDEQNYCEACGCEIGFRFG